MASRGGTGAAFALIPAQNATGNWIKVVQRLPVRIRLDPAELAAHPLQVGLSMTRQNRPAQQRPEQEDIMSNAPTAHNDQPALQRRHALGGRPSSWRWPTSSPCST